MENITLTDVYQEIISMKKEFKYLESMLIPEIQLSKEETKELNKLREEYKKELKEGKMIPIDDI